MKALLINPKDKTVTEVEHDGDYKQIYQLIEAHAFDCVRIDEFETIYVDDEGLCNGKVHTSGMFRVEGLYPVVLAGKALVLSTNKRGAAIATALTVQQVTDMIDFVVPMKLPGDIIVFIGDKSWYDGNGVDIQKKEKAR